MRPRPISPTRGRSTCWAGRRPSLWWRSRLPCVCAACWDGGRLPPADCRLSWRFRAAPRFTPALWPIPSTSPLSIEMAMSLLAAKTFAHGACAPTHAPGPRWSAPQFSPRPLLSNGCRLKNWRQLTFVIRNWVRWRRYMDVEIHPNAKKHLTEKTGAWCLARGC